MTLQPTVDGFLDIAIGKNRNTAKWQNTEYTWVKLLNRLSKTHITAETVKEYEKSSKQRQDEIKDVGGFVGGFLVDGRRRNGCVAHRQVLTLDLDFATQDFWFDFTCLYGDAACIYSTHKHTPKLPRLRLIMPLSRPCSPEEYEAVVRKIAGQLGIEMFDHTSFRPTQFMYWPSTSKDGQFVFEWQDGNWLDVDAVLDSYTDWRDTSSWPMAEGEKEAVKHGIKKQQDPTEKDGIVGYFCRSFDIHAAIDRFLPDIYSKCDNADSRYTYAAGTTSGGLVIYEDKFAFSHHGTDPISGKLVNAFDLVRIHKYKDLDEDLAEGTQVTRLPSFKAMEQLATSLPEVKEEIGRSAIAKAMGAFSDEYPEEGENPLQQFAENDDWLQNLEVDNKGKYVATIENCRQILLNDPNLKGAFSTDLFAQRGCITKNLPWRKLPDGREFTDIDEHGLVNYMEQVYKIAIRDKIMSALALVSYKNATHPVREYLNRLSWDGVERLDSLFVDYYGADDNEYTRAVARKWLCAAVARVLHPGVKFDYMPVLVGEQGKKKSMLADKLAMQWHSDSLSTMVGKEAYEQLQGVWIVEVAELSAMKGQEVEHVKHFISKRKDRFRVAYGKRAEDFNRQCVFIGTTNKKEFLKDVTGNRRFWPITTLVNAPTLDISAISRATIDQIWAEALAVYQRGEQLYLSEALEQLALNKQQEHREVDDRIGMVTKYLETKLPEAWGRMDEYERREYLRDEKQIAEIGKVERSRVCVMEIWVECFGKQKGDLNKLFGVQIHDMLSTIKGWQRYDGKLKFDLYGVQRGYVKVDKLVEK